MSMQTIPALNEHAGHVVQFYEDSSYLCGVVADFLASGLSNGAPALVVATEEHRTGIVEELQRRGVDSEHLRRQGRLALADARGLLDAFMSGASPDPSRFDDVVGGVVARCAGGQTLSIYGEMVDLLWRDGLPDAAIAVEALWNALATRHSFRLLCAYAMDNFSSADDAVAFASICNQHDHALPTERYAGSDPEARLRFISELQQRARALESEVRYRRVLEERLVTALQERDDLLERERRARTDAEFANRAKSDFLAVISHELRTPLNAISGYAELLELGVAGPLPEAQLQMVHRIQSGQRRLLDLIDEVLNFTRSENGVRQVVEHVHLRDVLAAVRLAVEPQMRDRQLTLVVAECDADIAVNGDPLRLEQIVLNLLTNAAKYTSAGGSVHLECQSAGDVARVLVRDSGIGIAPEHLDLIFEPFFQVDSSLTRSRDGLGLGLAIARRFARAMGGDIIVASSAAGSTFTLELPRRT